MTIAMCVIVPEGIVLGADSTASRSPEQGDFHYFNNNQKLFEIGEESSLGLLTWGLGGLGEVSYRTLVANLADDLATNPVASVEDVATRWSNLVWTQYNRIFANEIKKARKLELKGEHKPTAAPDKSMRTETEEKDFQLLQRNLFAGFCIAGYVKPGRDPMAYEIRLHPSFHTPATPIRIVRPGFWGAPNFILRLLNGFDHEVRGSLLSSKHWKGSESELDMILTKTALGVPALLPIRDAIDFVYFCIHATIKALKFSSLNQICGGPIELAVITTDRKFRWVRHKPWDAAIEEGGIS